jgi:hypothetical protein
LINARLSEKSQIDRTRRPSGDWDENVDIRIYESLDHHKNVIKKRSIANLSADDDSDWDDNVNSREHRSDRGSRSEGHPDED